MKKQTLLFAVCLLYVLTARSQQIFLDKVSIDYVKTVAVWPLFKEMEPEWFDQAKDHIPKQTVSYFNLISDGTKSLYKRTKEPEVPKGMWFQPFADNNLVYNDYAAGTTISQKPVFEETYLVKDSLINIKWKITPDTRVIAGFECRKAVGILFDSIAIFAFYTDDITITGGPEGINGLPGMILGVGIPRLHTTWFATKVEANGVNTALLVPATKGKTTTRKNMLGLLDKALKDWETYGQKLILAFVI